MRSLHFLLACLLSGLAAFWDIPSYAQINPDQTLGAESSVERSNVQVRGSEATLIEGGAVRGANLFHSFTEFSVLNNERVYFANPTGVESILSRVTGDNPSNIFGLLGIDGQADLFFINPNGVVLGEKAELDLQGSLSVATADGVQLGERGSFDAIRPEDSQLLDIQPSAFFFSNLNPHSTITALSNDRLDSSVRNRGLQVPDGERISLIAGDIILSGGNINAWEGHVDIVAVDSSGLVEIDSEDNLSISSEMDRGNLLLENRARVDVQFSTGGNILLIAKDITISSGSELLAGIEEERGVAEGAAGDLLIDASGIVTVSSAGTTISNVVEGNATGQAGNVIIKADSLLIFDDAQISTSTSGLGSAGNILITLESVQNHRSQNVLSLNNGAEIRSDTFDPENAGESFSPGNAGNIKIKADQLDVRNDSFLGSGSFNEGSAGDISLDVTGDIIFEGEGSGAFSGIQARSDRQNASIDGTGTGQGGNVLINAEGKLVVSNGARLASSNFSPAEEAGDVIIDVEDTVTVSGSGSGIFSDISNTSQSQASATVQGQSGTVTIAARALSVTDGAVIGAGSFTSGNAGNIVLEIQETALFTGESSGAFGSIGDTGEGKGGFLLVSAEDILIEDGAAISSSSSGEGDAGAVALIARNNIALRDGAISTTSASGEGGQITVQAGKLIVLDERSSITSFSQSVDNRGSATQSGSVQNGSISTAPGNGSTFIRQSGNQNFVFIGGSGNNLNSNTDLIIDQNSDRNSVIINDDGVFLNEGFIDNFIDPNGINGGDIVISSDALVLLDASDIVASSNEGKGGNINLENTSLFSDPNPGRTNIQSIREENTNLQQEINESAFNNQVDIVSTGATGGGDITPAPNLLVDNFLTDLPDGLINSETVVASSCIARSGNSDGTFILAGRDRLPQSPTESTSLYPSGTVQPIPSITAAEPSFIMEPQAIYQLPDGRLVMNRDCEDTTTSLEMDTSTQD